MKIKSIAMLAAAALILGAHAANHEIKPLKFKGKDFFMIGNWDPSWNGYPQIHPLLVQAGMNSFMLHAVMTDPAKFESAYELVKKMSVNYPEIAIIIDLDLNFIFKRTGNEFGHYPPEELEIKKKEFHNYISRLAEFDNIIGYSADEPENRIDKSYAKWEKHHSKTGRTFDQGIGEYLAECFSWIKAEINRTHPNTYFMPVIAWWTVYGLPYDLYDVLIANQYPVAGKEPLTGPFHEIAYDARLAAEAVKKLGRHSFVYCPAGFNILNAGMWKDMPDYTLEEMRYSWFAPVSMGAMGLMGWRMQRCSDKFAKDVIIKVMSEISSLTPWLLGRRLENAVTCDRTAMAAFKIRKRSKMMGKEDEDFDIREVAPECTYIVRENPRDKTVLVLAVNNCDKPLEAVFSLKMRNSGRVYDLISGERPKVNNNTVKVNFGPYGVSALIIEPR